MEKIPVYKDDILKNFYFVVSLTQSQTSSAMYGSLTSKGDLIGGIFDRWINTCPEAIVFNKFILPDISNNHDVKIISDFYSYDPKIAGIAPDVIGLKIDSDIVPFVKFEEKWKPLDCAPQIEVKTFKKPQKMVSLRNQGYDNKFLVLVESDFRIDYLVPFLDKNIFSKEIYNELKIDNRNFIISDLLGSIDVFSEVDYSFNQVGTISLLGIFKGCDFIKNSTCCEKGVSIQRISKIEEYTGNRVKNDLNTSLAKVSYKLKNNLYRFNNDWYDAIEDGIPCFEINGKLNKIRCLDFHCTNPDNIIILKKLKNGFYIKTSKISTFNMYTLFPDKKYKITTDILDRKDRKECEYFFQKESLSFIPSKEKELKESLKKYIK